MKQDEGIGGRGEEGEPKKGNTDKVEYSGSKKGGGRSWMENKVICSLTSEDLTC